MEYIIFAAAMLLILLMIWIKGYIDYKKGQKKFVEDLHKNYGMPLQREYKPEQFSTISHYFEKHKKGFFIDDITWNDLNMDDIFKQMNFTYSSAGEEYLYYLLRTPLQNREELENREKQITFFQENEEERVAFQLIFSKLGRTGKFSIYDYLDYLDELGERSSLRHYLALILLVLSVALLFVNLPMGLLALVCVLIYNNLTYFKIKNDIDPYITSFGYIFRLFEAVREIGGHRTQVLEQEITALKKASQSLNGFKAGASLVMSSGRMSGSMNPLEIFFDFLRMGLHIDLIKFNQMLSQVRRHVDEIDGMLTILGKLEAAIAVGAYRKSMGTYCIPEFVTEKRIEGKELYHPLIREPVKNDLYTEKSVLITGSNASGKSTFLKTVAINLLLAQTIHTCLATSYKGGMFRLCSSMSLRDDVQGGSSYYMVEIRSLKRIMDLAASEGTPVLCFVDEVLRGTNTVERIAASTQILKSLAAGNCLCFAATHDIELTGLLEELYDNYHFSEEIKENDILFSYKLKAGRASSRNAILLLRIMGYDQRIIEQAEAMAGNFLHMGKWVRLDDAKIQ